jgi:hypothetical protein
MKLNNITIKKCNTWPAGASVCAVALMQCNAKQVKVK